MDRRGFLKMFGAVVGGVALEQAIPRGRVWSFPSEIKVAKPFMGAIHPYAAHDLETIWYDRSALEKLAMNLKFTEMSKVSPLPRSGKTINFIRYGEA